MHYEYYHNRGILKNINIKIPKNSIAFVFGPSGAGKAVLANIITKNIEQTKGEIFIDEVPINNINSNDLCYIPEENIELFSCTVLENITMFEKISMKRVVGICKKMGLHSKIQRKVFGYRTIINENDKCVLLELEIKLIAIARAILINPKILIIDGFNDVFDEVSVENINGLLKENDSIDAVIIFGRKLPKDLDYNISYRLNNGVIEEKIEKNIYK